jgi:hypothetical protein
VSNPIITENPDAVTPDAERAEYDAAVQRNNVEWDASIQKRKDALAFFERNKRNRTWAMLDAYKDSDKAWFPVLVHLLATRGLISGRVLERALDAAWFECGSGTLLLKQWVEVYNVANGKTAVRAQRNTGFLTLADVQAVES